MGQIYFRQEKYEMAEYQFKRALQVYCLHENLTLLCARYFRGSVGHAE